MMPHDALRPLRPFVLALLAASLLSAAATAGNWPQFRGPGASGVLPEVEPPTTFGGPEAEHLDWKAPIPGLGHSAPAVWDDKVFVATAEGGKDDVLRVGLYGAIQSVPDASVHTWWLLCFDLATGEELWRTKLHEGVPAIKRHTKATHANSTPAVDAERVVVFLGSEGLHAVDHAGKKLWSRDFGVLDAGFFQAPGAQWGFGSSPVLHDGRVIVQADVQKNSFVAVLNAATGEDLWRVDRRDVPTWSTPAVYEGPKGDQVVVNGFRHIGGYDLATGESLWKLRGGGDIPVPTPLIEGGVAYITNAHGPAAPIYAIDLAGRGDISLSSGESANEFVTWSTRRDGAYMQTPVLYRGLLYVCRDNGTLGVYDAASGEEKYRTRIAHGTGFTASAVAADGRLYFTSEDGDVYVVKAGPEYELLATNEIGEVTLATPALADGDRILFRTRGHLMSFSGSASETPADEAPAASR